MMNHKKTYLRLGTLTLKPLKDWSIDYSWVIVQTNTYSNKRVILSQFRVCFVKKVYKIDQNERAEVEQKLTPTSLFL